MEGSNFKLIDINIGKSTTIQSLPHISPNKKKVICAYSEFTYKEGVVFYLDSISKIIFKEGLK